MMAGVEDCDLAIMTGYHSCAYADTNPLAHTMNRQNMFVKINGHPVSEFEINALFAAYYKVPVVFISGDAGICRTAESLVPGLVSAPVVEGVGKATLSVHPKKAEEMIYEGVLAAIKDRDNIQPIDMPEHFEVEIMFKEIGRAYSGSFYPDAKQIDERTLGFETDDFYEVVRFFYFVL